MDPVIKKLLLFHGGINLLYVESSFLLAMQVIHWKLIWPYGPFVSGVTWELLLQLEYVCAVLERDFSPELTVTFCKLAKYDIKLLKYAEELL